MTEVIFETSKTISRISVDNDDNVYAVTTEGTVLKVSPDGQSQEIVTGLERCGFSSRVLAVYDEHHLLTNDCEDKKDVLLKIDHRGNHVKLMTFDDSLQSMTVDISGRIYLGFWKTEGNIAVNLQPFNYLARADNMWGEISILDKDGILQKMYQGGIPMTLSTSPTGSLYATVWGKKGPYSPEEREYSVCGSKNIFWVTLGEQTIIRQLDAESGSQIITDKLHSADYIAVGKPGTFAFGNLEDGKCGIFKIKDDNVSLLEFSDESPVNNVTDITVTEKSLYFADADGKIKRVDFSFEDLKSLAEDGNGGFISDDSETLRRGGDLAQQNVADFLGSADQGLICEAQELLARLGYEPGPIDGLPGRKTETAALAFMADTAASVGFIESLRDKYQSAVQNSEGHGSFGVNRPRSGSLIEQSKGRGIAPLEIVTPGEGKDFYVKVEEFATGRTVRSVYVRTGSSAEIKVPLGNYTLKYATGVDWLGKNCLFGRETRYGQTDEVFEFSRQGDAVTGYRVELGVADNSQVACTDAPAFSATTAEPVLLRHKLKRGQLLRLKLDTVTSMRMGVGGQLLDLGEQTMRLEAKVRVTEVDAQGNISVLAKITRIYMQMKGMVQAEFDSDQPDSDNPAYEAVNAMIGVGIPSRISPIGEMLETDLEPLRLAIRRLNDAALTKAFEDSTSKMFEGTFVQLSKDPIAAGQSYEAGTIVSDQMKVRASYKVASVNDTKTRAILNPMGTMELSAPPIPEAEVRLADSDVSGWLLFDVERGFVPEGVICVHTLMDVTADGQTMQMDITMTMRAEATLN